MRDIKFRGNNGKIWIHGDLMQISWGVAIIPKIGGIPIQVIEDSVGQYTGLKDKNGKEIYEGDILANDSLRTMRPHIIGEVKYNEKRCCYEVFISKEDEYLNMHLSAAVRGILSAYVAGNVYDNPDLLKGK